MDEDGLEYMLGLPTAPASLYNTEVTGIPSLGIRSADEDILISLSETKIKKKKDDHFERNGNFFFCKGPRLLGVK